MLKLATIALCASIALPTLASFAYADERRSVRSHVTKKHYGNKRQRKHYRHGYKRDRYYHDRRYSNRLRGTRHTPSFILGGNSSASANAIGNNVSIGGELQDFAVPILNPVSSVIEVGDNKTALGEHRAALRGEGTGRGFSIIAGRDHNDRVALPTYMPEIEISKDGEEWIIYHD